MYIYIYTEVDLVAPAAHWDVPGQIEFRALAFIPSTMPFELTRDMFSPEGRAMRLYVKRVFINDKFEDGIWKGSGYFELIY